MRWLAAVLAVSAMGFAQGRSNAQEDHSPVVKTSDTKGAGIVIPSGTYVQGKISHIQRGGHIKGRAELMIHFTSLIYPSGYTVMLPGALENVPGAEHATTKGTEGTVRQDSDAGKKVETAAKTAGAGATIGGLTGGWKGAGIGGGIGAGVGAAIGMLSRGADVRLEPGTSVEMVIQRDVALDASRLPGPSY